MEVKRHTKEEAQAIMDRLQKLSCDELHESFKQGRVPLFEEIKGKNLGVELGWDTKAPKWFRVGWSIAGNNPFARWSGIEFIKPFDEEQRGDGIDLYNNRIMPRRFPFKTYITEAVYDRNLCLRIDYGFPGGFDDARMIEDGVLLAQGYAKVRLPWKTIPVLGFYRVTVSVEKSA
jgi:hypothetical protein